MSQDNFRRNGTGHFVLERLHAEGKAAAAPRPSAPRPPSAAEEKARKLYDQATKEFSRKALAAAETSVRLALTFNPNDRDALRLLETVKLLRDEERRSRTTLKVGS